VRATPCGCTETRLDVLIDRFEAVSANVVVTHIHRRRFGDHIQTVSSAAPLDDCRTSSDAGYDCQKFLRLAASPPPTSPAKTKPDARLPAPAVSRHFEHWYA
jgi:hypothetical protein